MDTWLKDVRHALRTFARNPAFAATAILALALGIGVNTAVFSLVSRIVLEPLPVPEPDRLIFLMNKSNDGVPIRLASPLNFTHWRAETGVLEDVAAWRTLALDYRAGDTADTVTVRATLGSNPPRRCPP